jgi:3-dehydroquinate synthase
MNMNILDTKFKNAFLSERYDEISHGGTGYLNKIRLFNYDFFDTPIDFIDYVIMPPGSTIGLHTHQNDEEIYFIIKGNGIMEADEEIFDVKTGDVVVNKVGGTHALSNASTEDIELFIFQVSLDNYKLGRNIIEDKSRISVNGMKNFNYDIIQSRNVFDINNKSIERCVKNRKLLIVISDTIERLYYDRIDNYFENVAGKGMYSIVKINTGEGFKNIDNVQQVLEKAKHFGLGRRSLMVAIGGGILMDIVGFAASVFRRGINYIRIPTTLLGQIDAGIGIKTGTNFIGSKNYIGTFYPPAAVINDIELLKTLPLHEIRNGLAEIIKMAILVDRRLFELVEDNIPCLLDKCCDTETELEITGRAIITMIDQLKVNFYELNLERLVDFGHTFSPFIETNSNYSISHGFAVAMDMAISTEISYLKGKISADEHDRILNLFLKAGLNIYNEKTYISKPMWASLHDIELHRGGDLNLVVPLEIGNAAFIKNLGDLSENILGQALDNLGEFEYQFFGGDRLEGRYCV